MLQLFLTLFASPQIGCAGAVLSDVQRRKAAEYLPNDPDVRFAFRVRSIEMFALSSSMFVNTDALASLQILNSEHHPNHVNQAPDKSKSEAKEGLSVYGLFHVLTHTEQGKAKLRQLFLRPSVDLDLIHERQRTISMFLRLENYAAVDQICKLLRRIKNMKSCLLLIKKGVGVSGSRATADRSTWATLQAFSAYAIELREVISKLVGADSVSITSAVSPKPTPRSICLSS